MADGMKHCVSKGGCCQVLGLRAHGQLEAIRISYNMALEHCLQIHCKLVHTRSLDGLDLGGCEVTGGPHSASDGQLPDKVLKFLTAKQHVEELATVHEVCVVVKPLGPMSIIHVTQLGVAHDLVCLPQQLELLVRLRIAWVFVRVVTPCKQVVCLLDLLRLSIVGYLQYFIIVHAFGSSWLEERSCGSLCCLGCDNGTIRLVDPLPLPIIPDFVACALPNRLPRVGHSTRDLDQTHAYAHNRHDSSANHTCHQSLCTSLDAASMGADDGPCHKPHCSSGHTLEHGLGARRQPCPSVTGFSKAKEVVEIYVGFPLLHHHTITLRHS
mmetsp:Transcript_23340/g.64499  ORF Transcript_23340/g.64499 Transcript_23340/m.64499 type:complete len:325 (+) Transcript_23340:850-1824(+)